MSPVQPQQPKGPLSQSGIEIKSEPKPLSREDVVRDIESKHHILLQDGSEVALDLSDPEKIKKAFEEINDPSLLAYILSEEVKGQPKQEAPSIKEMQRLEMYDYEPASDLGNMRMYPKGVLLYELLKDWADEIAINRLGAMKIESPLLYSRDDPEIREQVSSFHERHYVVRGGDDDKKEFILRFAGDFGLFKIMKDANFSYKVLPVRMYEYSKSFRYEKSGELSGLKRVRAMNIPDVHCFCKNLEEGWNEYIQLYKKYDDLAKGVGIEYAIGFRIVKEFYEKHKDKLVELARYSKRPVFIEVLSKMKHYWAVKHEFQGIDSVRGNLQLSTVQLDVKDAKVYGINYVNEKGEKEGCIICHSSIGSIERWIYSVLEEALKKEKPSLPLWLAPSQVRLLPVSEKHLDYCLKVAMNKVRLEVDDSKDSLGKKIAKAGKDWVPYVAVVGDKEIESGMLMVQCRADGSKREMLPLALESEICAKCKEFPFRPLPLNKRISLRPIFRG